jgi:hypothetical protein
MQVFMWSGWRFCPILTQKETRTDILAQVQNVNSDENSTARITLLYEDSQVNGRKWQIPRTRFSSFLLVITLFFK